MKFKTINYLTFPYKIGMQVRALYHIEKNIDDIGIVISHDRSSKYFIGVKWTNPHKITGFYSPDELKII